MDCPLVKQRIIEDIISVNADFIMCALLGRGLKQKRESLD